MIPCFVLRFVVSSPVVQKGGIVPHKNLHKTKWDFLTQPAGPNQDLIPNTKFLPICDWLPIAGCKLASH